MKKILVVVGSGSQTGNTYKLAEAYTKGAQKAGHQVHTAFLGDKNIVGCQGCGACSKSNICAIKDDMHEFYELASQSDVLVFASPLYFWAITAKLKAFIERLYAICQDGKYPHKETVLLMTAGDDNFWTFEQPISYYRFLTKALDWTDVGIYTAGGCSKSKGKNITEQHLQNAYQLGLNLKGDTDEK